MCLWSFVHGEAFSWRFFIVSIFGDSHCEEFFILADFFFFFNFVLWDFSIVKICSMLILRLKICFSLLVLRLKIFVLVIWLRVIDLGLNFKMDANSGLEFGILIDSGSELKFWNDLSTLVVYLGWLFAQLSWFCLFLNVSLKFWVWWLLCDHVYDWFVNLAQWFCFHELIQIWMFSFEFVFFKLELLFVVIFNLLVNFKSWLCWIRLG